MGRIGVGEATHVQHPWEAHLPILAGIEGGGGAACPLQNRLSLPPPPHNSWLLPEQAILQSVAAAAVDPASR